MGAAGKNEDQIIETVTENMQVDSEITNLRKTMKEEAIK